MILFFAPPPSWVIIFALALTAMRIVIVRAVPASNTVKYAGVNIAGFEFGCDTDGNCSAETAYPPISKFGGNDGPGQMKHFVNDDGYNAFRLGVSWQYLTNNEETGELDRDNFAEYDSLVQACLDAGASLCIIDLHNFGRFNNRLIGQGGPSNPLFSTLWSNIAKKYFDNPRVAFALNHQPHHIPNIAEWAKTLQSAVSGIRDVGAKSQIILLPGSGWASATSFIRDGSALALKAIRNPDKSDTGLVFDVHRYLDYDGSGTHAECITNNINMGWKPLVKWLRKNKRKILVSETGGSANTTSCLKFMCQQIDFFDESNDVILGYIGTSAGNSEPGSILSQVPTLNSDGTWTDQELVRECMAPNANRTIKAKQKRWAVAWGEL